MTDVTNWGEKVKGILGPRSGEVDSKQKNPPKAVGSSSVK